METIAMYLLVTFVAGLLAIALRLPPLVGFLAAGFILNASGVERLPEISGIAHLGVTLLLFAVGLKLELRNLLRREAWLTATVHMAASVAAGLALLLVLSLVGFSLLAGWTWTTLAVIAFALSFSSTVLVVKVLAERGETQALYGRIAISVLIIQDIAAVVFIGIATGTAPSPWAALLVLLVPLAWVLRRIWDRIGHDELQLLFGIVVAIVPGYVAFESVGLRGDLGAVVVGMLLASHPSAGELAQDLFGLKELLLIAFFVSIGLEGLPTAENLAVAVLLQLLLPVNGFGYALLLWLQRLRHRTAVMAALSLTNHSEFALIVVVMGVEAGLLDEDWTLVISMAVALSFVISTLVNRHAPALAPWLQAHLPHRPPERLNPIDRPIDIADAEAIVLGMGRTGSGAYQALTEEYGLRVIGIDADDQVVLEHRRDGWDVREGDATDDDFWDRVTSHSHIRLAILAMPLHEVNLYALDRLRRSGFTGVVGSLAQYDDDVDELRERGADAVFHLYGDVGSALATEVAREAGLMEEE
ncbi:MAG: potassium transporter Kef [Actinomycetales bacterium]|nr:potassium transporter Kef [Actinomycetales bacterium]